MICIHCHHDVTDHAVDDEERRECLSPGCPCRQYEWQKAGLAWTCEATEPGRRNTRPTWTAQIGPARLVAQQMGEDWGVHLEGAGHEETGHLYTSLGEAMEQAEPWALGVLQRWARLGEVARAALEAL